jgi:hypothetical protein
MPLQDSLVTVSVLRGELPHLEIVGFSTLPVFDIRIPSDLLLVEAQTNVILALFAFCAMGNPAAECNSVVQRGDLCYFTWFPLVRGDEAGAVGADVIRMRKFRSRGSVIFRAG